ncbi:MAG: hypothetical protein HOO88_00295 [Kiritimatiellaceae bacterium]|nr:hypothetical protein [Kiritimatiellaceae bacterium]
MDRASHPASFIWDEPTGNGRNLFRRFLLNFTLSSPATSATLNLFADSRYRLIVNGAFIGAGPARFAPGHPEYDSYDIAAHLHPGSNTICVEATSYGASSFQTSRESAGGFIAWGEAVAGETISFATPGAWSVQVMDAWDAQAPTFSFAIGPAEILDTRKLDANKPRTPVKIANQNRWGTLMPRSVPCSTFAALMPDKKAIFDLARDESIIGFRQMYPDRCSKNSAKRCVLYAAWIHAPREQMTDIGIFWGKHYLNGTPLVYRAEPLRGNRQNTTLHLKAGWNLLYGEIEQLEEVWGLLLGIPRQAGLTIRSEPEVHCTTGLLYSELTPPENTPSANNAVPFDHESLRSSGIVWNTVPADSEPQLPARLRAWDIVAGTSEETAPMQTGARAWVYEFKKEFDGYITVEVEAPAGTVLDVGVDDWLRKDGLIRLYGSNPFVNAVDRYILRGGRQKIQSFHVRGGHFLQLTLSLPDGETGTAHIHDAHILSANCHFPNLGSFECSEPVLNWAYATAFRTLQVSTEDSYADCPWRERGTYLGDGYVNIHMHEMVNADRRIPNRFLRLFAYSQLGNGQMPASAPSWTVSCLSDFTLIWILCLHDYWKLTQDAALVETLWPALENILSSPEWIADETGLWGSDHLNVFIDWGVLREERLGRANAVLNAFRIRALECAAVMAGVIGKTNRAEALREELSAVRTAFEKHLWIDSEDRFAPYLNADGSQAKTTALHANILATLYRIGSEKQQDAACRYIEKRLKRNAADAQINGQFSGHAEYYFLFYAIEMLYQRGRIGTAEQVIRDHYRPMMKADSGTLWECLCRGVQEVGSRCHSWGGEPLISAMRHTLGVQLPDPKNPNKVLIAPQADTIDWARGTYPHPKGSIHVEWKRVEGKIELNYTAPEGVEVLCAP